MHREMRFILAGLAALAMICGTVTASITTTVPHDLIALATVIIGVLVGERYGVYAERARHALNGPPPPPPLPPPPRPPTT